MNPGREYVIVVFLLWNLLLNWWNKNSESPESEISNLKKYDWSKCDWRFWLLFSETGVRVVWDKAVHPHQTWFRGSKKRICPNQFEYLWRIVTSICQGFKAAPGVVGQLLQLQLVKFKGCVRQSIWQGAPLSLLLLRSWESAAATAGPPTLRPVRGAARLVGEPFLLCVIGRSTSDVLGGPRKPADGRVSAASACPRVSPYTAQALLSVWTSSLSLLA